MTDYSETFLDHYRRPRNLGDLEFPDAVALVREPACGDVMRLALRLKKGRDDAGSPDPAGGAVIAEARFKAYGCAAAIATGSALTELIVGSTPRAASRIDARRLVEALDGLPPGRLHAAALGIETLRAALARLGAIPDN